jgi:hypothetical protein
MSSGRSCWVNWSRLLQLAVGLPHITALVSAKRRKSTLVHWQAPPQYPQPGVPAVMRPQVTLARVPAAREARHLLELLPHLGVTA